MGDHQCRTVGYQGEPRRRTALMSSRGERELNDNLLAGLCPAQIIVPQRQGADALASDPKDGVTHRWGNWRHAWLADPTPFGAASERQVRLYLGHSVETQHRVVIEIALDYAALFDGNLAVQSRCQAPNDTAFYLFGDGQWIDHMAAVNGTYDALNPDLAPLAYRHFGDLGDDGAVALDDGDTLRCSRWH